MYAEEQITSNDDLFPILTVEVAKDGQSYEKYKSITKAELDKISPSDSLIVSINKILKTCWNCSEKLVYKNYRVYIQFQEISYYITEINYDTEKMEKHFSDCRDVEYLKFDYLTEKEAIYLCLLYRQYQRRQVLNLFGVKKSTYKTHCKNIYTKLNFKDRKDLESWCDKYLEKFIEKFLFPSCKINYDLKTKQRLKG